MKEGGAMKELAVRYCDADTCERCAKAKAERLWGPNAHVWEGGGTYVVGVMTHAGSAFEHKGVGKSWTEAFADAK